MDRSPTRPRPARPVTKTMHPHQPGAKKWGLRYGAALVCVRYRQCSDRRTRYTTVELIVERMPLRRPRADPMVEVHGPIRDAETRVQAMALGAQWDSTRRIWQMPLSAARKLRLPMHEIKPSKVARSAHRD
jgi:hypothetical protein